MSILALLYALYVVFFFTAGDYVKFGFPMAGAMTILSWGGISNAPGYQKAGMLGYLRDAVKWGTDYLIKAHVAPDVFYGQVGEGDFDHSFWGRPEDMPDYRPGFKIDPQNPGSDLAAESAAALASASILFKDEDSAYSDELLQHAIELFELADNYRGKYSDSISDASKFYK